MPRITCNETGLPIPKASLCGIGCNRGDSLGKPANEDKGSEAFVTFINSCYNAYCEPTPDGILLEVTLVGRDERAAATAAANVAKPLTEEKISAALQYAALKGLYAYIGDKLVAPSKDGGASTKKVADYSELFARNLSYERHFNGAAADIFQRVNKE